MDWTKLRGMGDQVDPEGAKEFFSAFDAWLEVRGYSDETAAHVLGIKEDLVRLMKEETFKSESGRKATPNIRKIGHMIRRITIDMTKEIVGDEGVSGFYKDDVNEGVSVEDFNKMMGE